MYPAPLHTRMTVILHRVYSHNHSCWESNSAVALLCPVVSVPYPLPPPLLWLLHAFNHFLHDILWAVEGGIQMPYLGLRLTSHLFSSLVPVCKSLEYLSITERSISDQGWEQHQSTGINVVIQEAIWGAHRVYLARHSNRLPTKANDLPAMAFWLRL